jgi:hypothetical protein
MESECPGLPLGLDALAGTGAIKSTAFDMLTYLEAQTLAALRVEATPLM